MDIFKYIHGGKKYIVNVELGKSFKKYIEMDKDEYILLVPNSVLLDKWSIQELSKNYYIVEIFELANCYLGTFNEPYMLWHIAKEKPMYIKTAVYYEYAHPYRDNDYSNLQLRVPDQYTNNFKLYISELEKWQKTNKYPKNLLEYCEFNLIPYQEFETTKMYARFYKKSNKHLREVLRNTETVMLGEIAEIVNVYFLDGGNNTTRVKSLKCNKIPNYPYHPELCVENGIISTELLHKDDIVYVNQKFFLIDKESDFPLYAPVGCSLIRTKKYSPEYIYLYLSSRIAEEIYFSFKVPLGDHISTGTNLDEFPVIVPKEDLDVYREKFIKISTPDIRYYEDEFVSCNQKVEDILAQELTQKIKINSEELVMSQVQEDIEELNTCFLHKAYKATLILAGSIMEAILIDWLSEIRHINYFEVTLNKRKYNKELRDYEKNADGEYIYDKSKRADLADYIDEIRDLKRPSWMEEAEAAHKIRDKRNLVHAKLCLKKNAEINEEICREVIDYLKKIIESRWK